MHDPFMNSEDETFEVDESASAALSPGDYIAKVIDVEKGQSKSDNPMFTWTMQLLSDTEGNMLSSSMELKTYTALTDKAMWKVEEVLGALGLGKVEDGRLKAKFSKKQALGTMCVVEVEDTEFNGQTRSSIAKVKAHPNGAGYRPDM